MAHRQIDAATFDGGLSVPTRTIIEYALRDARKPIGVATYEITRILPKELNDQLPSPEAITRLLESI